MIDFLNETPQNTRDNNIKRHMKQKLLSTPNNCFVKKKHIDDFRGLVKGKRDSKSEKRL